MEYSVERIVLRLVVILVSIFVVINLDDCFLIFYMNINYLGISVKCIFRLSKFGWVLRFFIYNEFLGD